MLKIQKTVPALLAGAFLQPAFTAQAQVATTTSLTSSENPSHVSDSVTFTATVSSNGGAAPTGSVQFTDFRTSNQVSVALTPGAGDTSTAMITFATIDPGTLQTGTHGMQANYQPTGNFGSSVGSVIQQVIADGVTGTTTTLISSQNPSASGQSVTFTATVSADSGTTAPTGTVSFLVDGTTASTPTLQTVGGLQQATFTTSSLTVAPNGHNITAIYNLNGGNASFAESSASLTQTVTNGTPTTIAVASSVNPSTANQSVTLTATVSVASGFSGSPTGSVDFKDITTNTDLGTATLQTVGGAQQASVTASFVQVETHTIQVTYTPNTMTRPRRFQPDRHQRHRHYGLDSVLAKSKFPRQSGDLHRNGQADQRHRHADGQCHCPRYDSRRIWVDGCYLEQRAGHAYHQQQQSQSCGWKQ